MLSTTSLSYTKTAKILHWLIALAIIFMLALGWTFGFFHGETKFFLFQLHKSIGITILLLSFVRLAWRLMHTAPSLPASMPLWEQRAAHIGHVLLYILMIGMPLSGWIMVSTSLHNNIPTILYGILPWPNVPVLSTMENKTEISHFMGGVHGYAAYVLAALIVGHAGAALKHHFIARDDILVRMAPSSCTRFLNYLRGSK